jgi:cell fate regulator YaaT (PSP1 superfamily)
MQQGRERRDAASQQGRGDPRAPARASASRQDRPGEPQPARPGRSERQRPERERGRRPDRGGHGRPSAPTGTRSGPAAAAEARLPRRGPEAAGGTEATAAPEPRDRGAGGAFDDAAPALVIGDEGAEGPVAPEPPDEPRDAEGEDVFRPADDAADQPSARGTLTVVAGVKFHDSGTIHECDAGDTTWRRGERVVIESDRGPVVGTVAVESRRLVVTAPLRRILRRAGADDERQRERNARREREAFEFCRERIRARKLPMKLVRAEYALQGSKVLFYFASEERVDFRDLVKDLASRLHGRIEMRQVGARDEAKMVGGIGDCGRELCCSTFLPAFAPVSIKMAKDQGMVLNPSRVTGQCGRLKCCLVYEHAAYLELRQTLPKVGKRVRTPAGDGKVVELDVLRQLVRVGFEEGGSETFPGSAVQLLAPPPPPGRGPPTEG